MATLIELWSYDFIRQAVFAALLASFLCGVIGTFVVVKRLVFISGGVSHAAFGGLGVCYYLGVEPLIGAGVVAIASALLVAAGGRRWVRSQDAVIGILWSVGMAIGVVFVALSPGYAPNLMTYLFGNILTVSQGAVLVTFWFTLVVLGFALLFFKEFVAVSFDEEFARVQGVPVGVFMAILMVMVALSVVLLIQLVGIILVIALLTIPPVISLMLTRGFVWVILVSTFIGALMTLGGLALSYVFDLPSGPTMVLLGALLMLPAYLWQRLVRRDFGKPPDDLRA
ncbi:MAG: metal ABC transporter permease, partial [Thermoanaerobaculia bacterium]